VPAQTILEQVYIRERHIPCFENGVAIPHARVDSGPLVSIYLGLYSRGVPWVDGNKAFVVLLFIAAADAPETYGAYLAQACRILRDQDSMNDLLRARTKTDALAAIRLAEVRMGAPLPTVEARKVLVVESIADEQTLLRDRMINENPRMEGVRVEYFYACSERDGDIQFDPLVFEEALRSRIERGNPDFVLLHTGIAFRRYKEGLTRVFKSLRGQFPKVRFGCQESRAIAVDSEAFDHDSQTLKFQQEFFTVGHGG
jgi:mannitol/fructose-specific phosphotransferase system IIA component (Ntr-type)